MHRIRRVFFDYRFVNNAMLAMLGAVIVTVAVDIAIDATWVADLFFVVFAGSLVVFYRGEFAPPKPLGFGLLVLAWLLIAAIVAMAAIRVAYHAEKIVA